MAILGARPEEGFALERVMDLYRERDGNVDKFIADLGARVTSAPDPYAP